jgi:hypothetical protein
VAYNTLLFIIPIPRLRGKQMEFSQNTLFVHGREDLQFWHNDEYEGEEVLKSGYL